MSSCANYSRCSLITSTEIYLLHGMSFGQSHSIPMYLLGSSISWWCSLTGWTFYYYIVYLDGFQNIYIENHLDPKKDTITSKYITAWGYTFRYILMQKGGICRGICNVFEALRKPLLRVLDPKKERHCTWLEHFRNRLESLRPILTEWILCVIICMLKLKISWQLLCWNWSCKWLGITWSRASTGIHSLVLTSY
jgi:hypothetical protein